MPFRNNNVTREDLISRYFPSYRLIAPQTHAGFSGASCIIEEGENRLVLRQHHDAAAPAFHFRRQYNALKRLPSDVVPDPRFFKHGWMAVEFLAGEIKSALPDAPTLAGMLYHLHRQSLLGWRITVLPLLDYYWQQAAPGRHTPFWLVTLKRLRTRGEPQPLRLAPLHMDVHAGNLVHTHDGLRLIDWEYAGDGDIAMELAGVRPSHLQRRHADPQRMARPRQRDIEHLLVDQIGRAAVGVDQDPIGGLALRSVCGLDIGMAQMGVARL